MQPVHLPLQPGAAVPVQPVRNQKHHGALTESPARPQPIELAERLADPRAAVPVLGDLADLVERFVDILVAQITCDVGQPRAEQEGMHAVPVVGDSVQEVQQHARITAHRTGDIA